MDDYTRFRVTFSDKINALSGTVISNSSVKEVELPLALRSVTSDIFSGCTGLDTILIGSNEYTRGDSGNTITVEINGKEAILFLD